MRKPFSLAISAALIALVVGCQTVAPRGYTICNSDGCGDNVTINIVK